MLQSILEEQVLTMEAGRVVSFDDQRPRNVHGISLLPAVALYGANASGKSHLLSALGFMRDAGLSPWTQTEAIGWSLDRATSATVPRTPIHPP